MGVQILSCYRNKTLQVITLYGTSLVYFIVSEVYSMVAWSQCVYGPWKGQKLMCVTEEAPNVQSRSE